MVRLILSATFLLLSCVSVGWASATVVRPIQLQAAPTAVSSVIDAAYRRGHLIVFAIIVGILATIDKMEPST